MVTFNDLPKIYLDTSVISHLEQDEKPYEQAGSHALFRVIRKGLFATYLSAIVFEEIDKCEVGLRKTLLKHVNSIEYFEALVETNATKLANKLISRKILPKRCYNDCWHMALAVANGCDYIVSWNMKDMANARINEAVRRIVFEEGYKEIMLVPPSMLIGRNDSL